MISRSPVSLQCSPCASASVRVFTRACTVQYSTVQFSTVQYSTVQCSTAQYSTAQCSGVQYCARPFPCYEVVKTWKMLNLNLNINHVLLNLLKISMPWITTSIKWIYQLKNEEGLFSIRLVHLTFYQWMNIYLLIYFWCAVPSRSWSIICLIC